jgi:hypothetical protein
MADSTGGKTLSSRGLYFLRRLAIEFAIAIVTLFILVLILGGLSARSDFIAVHFGWLVAAPFGAIWVIRMIRPRTHENREEPVGTVTGGGEPILLKGGKVSELLAQLLTKPFLSLGIVLIFALFQALRFGNVHDYLFLAVGSCLSGAAIFGHGFIPMLDRGRKSWLLTFLALTGFVPYAFGCYLVFYRGFWGLRELFVRFTIAGLLACILFVVLGYQVVNGMYLLNELVEKASKKEIILK